MLRWFLLMSSVIYCHGETAAPLVPLNDGHKMPALALGTWHGRTSHGRIEPKGNEVEQAVTWAVEAGYRHIDVAALYAVEDQVGRAVKKLISDRKVKREDLFITIKLWSQRRDSRPRDAVVPALKESLKRLNVTYVDLYLIHWPVGQFGNKTYDPTDYLDTWSGMIAARDQGLTRSIGVSNFNQSHIDRILEAGMEKPSSLQVELNLDLQQPELLAYCKEKDIVVIGYIKEDAPPSKADGDRLKAIAAKYNKTVPQVTLRYLMELGVVPLTKSLTKSRIEENIQVFDFILTDDDKLQLRKLDKDYRNIFPSVWNDFP